MRLANKKSIISVDKNKLDEEAAKQAAEFLKWSELLADAEADEDDLKTELELTRAEIAYAVRRDPEKYEVPKSKISESMIDKSVIPLQPEYKDVVARLNAKKREIGHLKAMVKALTQKKEMIEKLAGLWLGGYFAEPRLPRNVQQEMAKRTPFKGMERPKQGKGSG